MNHFMLPEDQSSGKDAWSSADGTPSTRYGAYAMESLINETLKLGARRERLRDEAVRRRADTAGR